MVDRSWSETTSHERTEGKKGRLSLCSGSMFAMAAVFWVAAVLPGNFRELRWARIHDSTSVIVLDGLRLIRFDLTRANTSSVELADKPLEIVTDGRDIRIRDSRGYVFFGPSLRRKSSCRMPEGWRLSGLPEPSRFERLVERDDALGILEIRSCALKKMPDALHRAIQIDDAVWLTANRRFVGIERGGRDGAGASGLDLYTFPGFKHVRKELPGLGSAKFGSHVSSFGNDGRVSWGSGASPCYGLSEPGERIEGSIFAASRTSTVVEIVAIPEPVPACPTHEATTVLSGIEAKALSVGRDGTPPEGHEILIAVWDVRKGGLLIGSWDRDPAGTVVNSRLWLVSFPKRRGNFDYTKPKVRALVEMVR